MNVFEIVRLKIGDELPENELTLAIEEVGQAIKTLCNRTDIPSELAYVHANMVVDLLKLNAVAANPEAYVQAKSIKEGDTSIEFSGNVLSTTEVATQKIIHGYREQLLKFRKVGW